MSEYKASIYVRMSHRDSDELLAFLKEKQEAGEGPDLLDQALAADAEYKELGITVLLVLEVAQAIELEAALEKKVPTAEGDWTPLHSIRMDLMESLEEHKRHARDKARRGD